MALKGLNVCAGIDAGSKISKLAYYDSEGSRIIAGLEGFNPLLLREEAEIFFDEPVFSCVVSVSENLTRRKKDDIIFTAKRSGFKNVKIISDNEALNTALNSYGKILVCDFGASGIYIKFFDNGNLSDYEIIDDICGNEFDEVFAEWLTERFTLNLIDKKILLNKAEQIKITLSETEYVTWRDVKIFRDDFERLIYFTIKRASHSIQKLIRLNKPERFILTGGCSNIPCVKNIFEDETDIKPEIIDNLIAKGTAMKAASLSSENKTSEKINTSSKLRELRGKLIEIEELLTRNQKDRLYFLFRQAELISAADPEIINIMENLLREIKDS